MASSFLGFSLFFISLYGADGFEQYQVDRCDFSSTELKDMEYIYSIYYNKVEFIRFNSSVGKFVGYTELGVKNAENWNNDPAVLGRRKAEKERFCKASVEIFYPSVLTKTAPPSVRLSSVSPPGGKHTAMI
ncbi:H-2 class II histocompatibility antigen, E-Q beta chain-like, partial [Centroberyx affinis]|uniref:H-2 class II histocompatibility antigen, E-Q beta chain-like n=1 Tax=Centroberyx affinis TaxID=166261 RepID=UPI003A5C39FF